MLKECPSFESGPETEQMRAGTDRDQALNDYLQGNDGAFNLLDEDDQEAVIWAAEQIKMIAPMADHQLEFQKKLTWTGSDFDERSGTPDFVCGPVIIDLKSRPRNYEPQLADYATALFQRGYSKVTVIALFAVTKSTWKSVYSSQEEADAVTGPILDRANQDKPEANPCAYCGWCAKSATCSALTGPIKTIAAGYGDGDVNITKWPPSEMETPEQIGLALTIARKIVKPWCESVEYHAKEAAIKKGWAIPGFELSTRQGRKAINDVVTCYQLSGLPPEVFFQACSVRLNTPKGKLDQPGITELLIGASTGVITKKKAKEEVLRKLDTVIVQGPSTTSLKMVGETEE